MDSLTAQVDAASAADTQEMLEDLATWNRQRTSEELQQFINTHHALIPDSISIE